MPINHRYSEFPLFCLTLPSTRSAAAGATKEDDGGHRPQGTATTANSTSNSARNSIRRSMRGGNDDADDDAGAAGGGWHGKVSRRADELFYRLGRRVALSPKKTVAIALLCVFVCTFGFANFRVESDCEKNQREDELLVVVQSMSIVFFLSINQLDQSTSSSEIFTPTFSRSQF